MSRLLFPPAWLSPRLRRLMWWLSDEPGVAGLKWLVAVLIVAGMLGFLLEGANTPPRPVLTHQPLPAPVTGSP